MTNVSSLEASAVEAMAAISRSLASDDYALTVAETGPQRLAVTVHAPESGCNDCLVPKGVMSTIISTTLEKAGLVAAVELIYPSDAGPDI
jgi:hypothetical protein